MYVWIFDRPQIKCLTSSRETNKPIAKGLKRAYWQPYDNISVKTSLLRAKVDWTENPLCLHRPLKTTVSPIF